MSGANTGSVSTNSYVLVMLVRRTCGTPHFYNEICALKPKAYRTAQQQQPLYRVTKRKENEDGIDLAAPARRTTQQPA